MGIINVRNILLMVMLIVGFNYYQSTQDNDMQSLFLPIDTKILAFGDSLTAGYGVSKALSYPSVLSELLSSEVFNEGVSGEMSEQGLARLPALLEKYKPDILVLCHGANDILRRQDLQKMQENLSKMVSMAKEKGVYVLLVGVPTYGILSFNVPSLYYDVAKMHGIEIEDTSLPTIMETNDLKSDQVHPNAQGYNMMALRIAKLLTNHYHQGFKNF